MMANHIHKKNRNDNSNIRDITLSPLSSVDSDCIQKESCQRYVGALSYPY
jgi:hypothetical protein